MAIDKITLDATKCILAARLRGCNAPLAHPVWRLIPDRTCNHPILSSFRRRPQSPNPRLLFQLTPRAPLHVRCLITRRTGYRPAPVRRRRLVPPITTGSMIRGARPPPHHAHPSSFRRRPESEPTPTIPTHAPSAAARPVPHHRRTGYRPAPVRRAGRLVPLRRCLAGTTGWTLVPSPLPCRHDALDDPCRHRSARPTAAHRKPHPSSFRRRPESRTHAYYSNSRPDQPLRPVPLHAALGTGLRRYDGLDGWCLFSAALPV